MIWLKFAAIQLVMLIATVLGWLILLPFCWARAWHIQAGPPGTRLVDAWDWKPLNYVYGNYEDGVSGELALVWQANMKLGTATQVEYMPSEHVPAWWRAYCWSAWRNSCDELKYVFADPNGSLVTFKLFGRACKIGWQMENGYNVPVFSL